MPSPTSTLKVAYSSSLNLKLPFWRPEKIKIDIIFRAAKRLNKRSERNCCDIREKEKEKEEKKWSLFSSSLVFYS
jgi:hypothetical protein